MKKVEKKWIFKIIDRKSCWKNNRENPLKIIKWITNLKWILITYQKMDISGSMSSNNSLNMRPLFTGYPFQGILSWFILE